MLPECLDDWIDESNPVRAMDAYVDALDLAKLGFEGVAPEVTGRPSYHPSALLKLYIYGYLNRVQSSRRRRVVQIPDVQADREYHFLALRFERAATPGCTLIHPRRTLRGAAT